MRLSEYIMDETNLKPCLFAMSDINSLAVVLPHLLTRLYQTFLGNIGETGNLSKKKLTQTFLRI